MPVRNIRHAKLHITIRKFQLSIVMLFVIISANAQEDYYGSDEIVTAITETERHIYNLEYDSAEIYIAKLDEYLPVSPVPEIMRAMNRIWQSMPDAYPDDFDTIMDHLDASLRKSKNLLKKDRNNPEANFFTLVCHGLKAQFYNDRGSPFKALGEAQSAYDYVFKGMKLQEEFPEFYFTSGLYNYYREKYPEVYPVYKPLVWIFKRGDLELGLEQIKKSIREAPFSRTEASHYLAYIYLRYEQKPSSAIQILEPLVKQHPSNPYFRSLYVEALYLLNRLDEGEEDIAFLANNKNPFFAVYGIVYQGLYQEKIERNDRSAEERYRTALKQMDSMEGSLEHMESLCYLGLGRIYDRKGEEKKAREWYRKANKEAVAPFVMNESHEYLTN